MYTALRQKVVNYLGVFFLFADSKRKLQLPRPLKINMEHNHGGLVQIIFLSFYGSDLYVPAVKIFQGATPNPKKRLFKTFGNPESCLYFWGYLGFVPFGVCEASFLD